MDEYFIMEIVNIRENMQKQAVTLFIIAEEAYLLRLILFYFN